MRIAVSAVTAAMAVTSVLGGAQAQPPEPSPRQSSAPIKISLKFKDIALADLVAVIAREGDVQVLLEAGVGGTIGSISLQDATPEQALRQVARLARLEVRALSKTSFVVSAPAVAADKPAPAPSDNGLLGPAEDLGKVNGLLLREAAKPYVLRVMLAPTPNAVEQEIQVAAKDTFSISCRVEDVRYWIRGSSSPLPGAAGLQLSLRIERQAPPKDGAPEARTSIVTQVRLLPDGHEWMMGSTSAPPGAPAPLAPVISLHANPEANAQADAQPAAPK